MTQERMKELFDQLKKEYPSQEKLASGFKAFTVLLKQSSNPEKEATRIIEAAKVYAYLEVDSEFHYHLGNFIRENHWLDILELHSDYKELLKRIEEDQEAANEVVQTWKTRRRNHWMTIYDESFSKTFVIKALSDDFFRENWKDAFEIIHGNLCRPFPDGHKFDRLTVSIKWFCRVDRNKHTVHEIMEEKYGGKTHERKSPEYKDLTQEQRDDAIKLFREAFNEDFFRAIDAPKRRFKNEKARPESVSPIDGKGNRKIKKKKSKKKHPEAGEGKEAKTNQAGANSDLVKKILGTFGIKEREEPPTPRFEIDFGE